MITRRNGMDIDSIMDGMSERLSRKLDPLVGYAVFEKELKALCEKHGADLYCDYLSEQDGFVDWEVKFKWQPNANNEGRIAPKETTDER